MGSSFSVLAFPQSAHSRLVADNRFPAAAAAGTVVVAVVLANLAVFCNYRRT
jgi:hypothetical protein